MSRAFLFLLCGVWLVLGAVEPPSRPRPLSPEEAVRQGRALAEEIRLQTPGESLTNTATLHIRSGRVRSGIPVKSTIVLTETNWQSIYLAAFTNTLGAANPAGPVLERLIVTHTPGQPNRYEHALFYDTSAAPGSASTVVTRPKGADASVPFAGSDFWLLDLGLEFFHWPEQRILKTELRKHRQCRVLESTNPDPSPGSYSRVVSWIDIESNGIVLAEAYDFQGKRLKRFEATKVKKIEGQWQLAEMEISDFRTDSRTTMQFDLDR